MEVGDLVALFEIEAASLDAVLRTHPRLRPFFSRHFTGIDLDALRDAYLRLLKLKADYVRHTVPALRAAGNALRDGDDEDRAWSKVFLGYATGETDETSEKGDYGHDVWALEDMNVLGAGRAQREAPPHASATAYGKYFVDDASRHPYAILGAKGVLEHFSIRVSDDIVRGLLESGIPRASEAVTFFRHHGVLDVEHVREGDRNLGRLVGAQKRFQILEGAYFTAGAYRSLVHHALPT